MKLLLIDDQIDILTSLKRALKPLGYGCILSDDPVKAIKLFQNDHFDVVITDYRMAKLNGIDVLKKIQALKPGTPVILMTGYGDMDNAIQALNYGACAFYKKPLSLESLIQKLDEVTQKMKAEPTKDIQINKLLEEKETLLREVHHRVMNNMQLMKSLIRLQLDSTQKKECKELLTKISHRIHSITLVHQKLYRSNDMINMDLSEYITHLTHDLFQFYGITQNVIELELNLNPIFVNINKAVSWGLIVNELLVNALQHGFPESHKSKKKIMVTLEMNNNNDIEFIIKDTGIGLPKEFQIDRIHSLGLNLVRDIVDNNLGGRIKQFQKMGTCFKISVKPENIENANGLSRKQSFTNLSQGDSTFLFSSD